MGRSAREPASGKSSVEKPAARRLTARARLLLAAAFVAALTSPFAFSIARNDWLVSDRLDQLATELPTKTSTIKISTAVAGSTRGCRGLAAKVLATEQSVKRLSTFFATHASPQSDHELSLAWSDANGIHHRHAVPGADDETGAPTAVEKLLAQFAFLPDGVHRVVLYEQAPVPAGLDPRCL